MNDLDATDKVRDSSGRAFGYGTVWHIVAVPGDYRLTHLVWCDRPECWPLPQIQLHSTTDCGKTVAQRDRVLPDADCRACIDANVTAGRIKRGSRRGPQRV